MFRPDSPQHDLLADLGRFIAGVGMMAVAAGEALVARRLGPKSDLRPGAQSLADIMSIRPRPRRKPPESGLSVPAVPPRGPVPLKGEAAAALDPARG